MEADMARSQRRYSRRVYSTASAGQRRFRPALEFLEGRDLPDATPLMVTTSADSGAGSLREAIMTANTQTGPTTIDFAIGSGEQTIALLSVLPAITSPVVLDGTTQPGFSGTPLIVITGNPPLGSGTLANGLDVQANGSTIMGLCINGTYTQSDLFLESKGNTVQGNFFGTNAMGTAADGSTQTTGIVSNGGGNTIGGTTSQARNIISGNGFGIRAGGSDVVEGNYIGTDVTGAIALGNTTGIQSSGIIGGTQPGAGNVISGNTGDGLVIFSQAIVEGNMIGTNAAGSAALGNENGVRVFQGQNTIGGTVAGAGNTISGNKGDGILFTLEESQGGNVVEGNFVGTDPSGVKSIPNGTAGISVLFGQGITIGGTTASAENIISGNSGFGVYMVGGGISPTTGNVILGNHIGTNLAGSSALANGADGIAIIGATGNTIGGSTSAAGNIISGNGEFGMILASATGFNPDNNVIQNNKIGTDMGGAAAIANAFDGVYVSGGSNNNISSNLISGNGRFGVFLLGQSTSTGMVDSSNNAVQGNSIGVSQGGAVLGNTDDGVALFDGAINNTIGGTTSATGNIISGNARFGVYLNGSGTTGNVIEGNSVGTNASNATGLGNTLYGVVLIGAANNTIGGAATGAGNVVGDNGEFGILLTGGANGNLVQGNSVGVGSDGTKLPNTLDGIAVVASSNNTVGGTAAGTGNIVDDNARFGVFLTGDASGNFVQGNLIGVNAAGTAAAGNTDDAVALADGANGNTIGGTATNAGNVLSGNGRFGVFLTDRVTTDNVIEGNTIGLNEAAAAALSNTFDGIAILNGANSNTIGGTTSGAGNAIAANGRFGILLGAASGVNVIEGNTIGTNSAGKTGLGNALDGIGIIGSAINSIGGTVTGAGNVISGNARFGVFMDGVGATSNVLEHNVIGLAPNGSTALANTFDGVAVFDGAANNTIGGTATGQRPVRQRPLWCLLQRHRHQRQCAGRQPHRRGRSRSGRGQHLRWCRPPGRCLGQFSGRQRQRRRQHHCGQRSLWGPARLYPHRQFPRREFHRYQCHRRHGPWKHEQRRVHRAGIDRQHRGWNL
jgi:parallel beta-helix repeat protein